MDSQGFSYRWLDPPGNTIGRGIAAIEQELQQGLGGRLQPMVDDAVSVMVQTHPWVNRTHQAEQGLTGGVTRLPGEEGWVVYLAHGVSYGIFLEEAHGGVWGIVYDTMRSYEGRFMSALKGLLG